MIVFVVPVHGRHALADACLRHLALILDGRDATAVIVGNDERFERLADDLGFGWVTAPNKPLGRKWNDGIEHACRHLGADYVVPFGSDDVIDPVLLDGPLPTKREVRCMRQSSVVAPDGRQLVELEIGYAYGDGVRVWPVEMLAHVGYRPADDLRDRALDGSMTDRLTRAFRRPHPVYHDLHPLQVIDFKTDTPDQRTTFRSCAAGRDARVKVLALRDDFWADVEQIHGAELVDALAPIYGRARMVA